MINAFETFLETCKWKHGILSVIIMFKLSMPKPYLVEIKYQIQLTNLQKQREKPKIITSEQRATNGYPFSSSGINNNNRFF